MIDRKSAAWGLSDRLLTYNPSHTTANYNEPIRRFLDELFALADVFKDNKAGHVLQQDVSSLVHALVYDEQGQPKIKIELVKDIEVLLSAFLRKVRTTSVWCRCLFV